MTEEGFDRFIYKLINQTYNRLIEKDSANYYTSKNFSFLSACSIKFDLETFGCFNNYLMEVYGSDGVRTVNLYLYQDTFLVCNLPEYIEESQDTIANIADIVTPECLFNMSNISLCCPISQFLESHESDECFVIDIEKYPTFPLERAPRIPIREFLLSIGEKSSR